jgi:carboxylesterase type B
MKTAALIALLLAPTAIAQLTASDDWAVAALTRHQVFPDITYVVANNHEVKLDVYQRRDRQESLPVMIYIHGGSVARIGRGVLVG